MEHVMTVAEILDALYDCVGCSWCEGPSFVDEVAAWARENMTEADGCWRREHDDGWGGGARPRRRRAR